MSGARSGTGNLVFAFFTLFALKVVSTVVLFQGNPRLGTLFNAAITVAFAFGVLLIHLSGAVDVRRSRWPAPVLLVLGYLAWAGLSLVWTQSASLVSVAG